MILGTKTITDAIAKQINIKLYLLFGGILRKIMIRGVMIHIQKSRAINLLK